MQQILLFLFYELQDDGFLLFEFLLQLMVTMYQFRNRIFTLSKRFFNRILTPLLLDMLIMFSIAVRLVCKLVHF